MAHLDGLAGLFHPAQQLVEIIGWQRRPARKRVGRCIDETDRREILLGIECTLRIERHPCRQRVLVQQDRVAVGVGAGDLGRGDHAAGAADVFDYDRLTQCFLHRILEDARGRVVGAARRERYHDRDGTLRIGLRQGYA